MSRNLFQIWDMELAAKLRQLRDKRGVSEREISRALSKAAPEAKASPTTVGRWFSGAGMPSFVQAVELANYFGVPISYLAYDDAKPAPGELPEDEWAVIVLMRALQLSKEEALRRLATAPAAPVRWVEPEHFRENPLPPSGPEILDETPPPARDIPRKRRPG